MRLNKFIMATLLLFASSCIDRFIPETAGYDKVLFIQCLLSNDTASKPTIYISLSAPVATESGGKLTYKPASVPGASVHIQCDDGNDFVCTDQLTGAYHIPGELVPTPGKSYKLSVTYNGNTYESDFQTLHPSPPIDSITWKHVVDKLSEDGQIYDGYRFYISTHDDSATGPTYYRWSADATYLFTVPYLATHVWTGRTQEVASNKEIRTCWKSKTIQDFFIGKTAGLAENRITEAPLNFESQKGDELSIRYSLHVKQYYIAKSAMDFWENVNSLGQGTGSMYETQPYRIEGNIHCVNDPAAYVVGIFEVAGVTEKRIYVDKPDEFPNLPVACIQSIAGVDVPWYRLPRGTWLTFEPETGNYLVSTPSCYDCRERGGTLEKPPFWEGLNDRP
jgi:hypothetical protein